ncbi:MAG: cbb3-type cytochrome oxidase assembly protein CcoS [Cyclobacteriaceae bacterium]|jgi:cbb3-type cytochrome oxidase maturation protein|nr:cbb3-type cytochrome oxidase assembly protein CcoS [Cyclobacteriaceae bacterium]
MLIIILLISISLTIAIAFLVAFVWGMRSGQFDDAYGPSVRMLFDDSGKGNKRPMVSPPTKKTNTTK